MRVRTNKQLDPPPPSPVLFLPSLLPPSSKTRITVSLKCTCACCWTAVCDASNPRKGSGWTPVYLETLWGLLGGRGVLEVSLKNTSVREAFGWSTGAAAWAGAPERSQTQLWLGPVDLTVRGTEWTLWAWCKVSLWTEPNGPARNVFNEAPKTTLVGPSRIRALSDTLSVSLTLRADVVSSFCFFCVASAESSLLGIQRCEVLDGLRQQRGVLLCGCNPSGWVASRADSCLWRQGQLRTANSIT